MIESCIRWNRCSHAACNSATFYAMHHMVLMMIKWRRLWNQFQPFDPLTIEKQLDVE